jgi:DNA-binding winged helix-turn-helix (wHTH) protein/TolB-like protein
MKRQFGDFEIDLATRELRRGGEIVRLQAQPAQVLALLVARAGEVVTRDALREAIWGRDTFVDFDKGLNFAVAQVRAALGDSADAPTYIRTLPKRGYQLMVPVKDVEASASTQPALVPSSRTRARWFAAAAALIVIAGIGLFMSRTAAPPAIAVIAFDNETGAADLDQYARTVTDALVAELTTRGAGRIGVIGNAAALRIPRDRRDLLQVGKSLGARYIVLGQLQRDGDRLRMLAHLIRLPEQTHLWVVRIERGASDPLLPPDQAAQRISQEFLQKL